MKSLLAKTFYLNSMLPFMSAIAHGGTVSGIAMKIRW